MYHSGIVQHIGCHFIGPGRVCPWTWYVMPCVKSLNTDNELGTTLQVRAVRQRWWACNISLGSHTWSPLNGVSDLSYFWSQLKTLTWMGHNEISPYWLRLPILACDRPLHGCLQKNWVSVENTSGNLTCPLENGQPIHHILTHPH